MNVHTREMRRSTGTGRAWALGSFLLAAAFGLGAALSARADCPPEWLPGEGIPGLDDTARAMTTWDPDGPGGQPELLVVGGYFTIAGNVFANNIAAWDGATWQSLGSGMNGGVLALTVYNGELIAGGDFTTAGGNPASCIARWNGSTWQPLGSGMGGYYPWVDALTVYNGELIAGGWFTTAGGNPASYIARWNGATWQALDNGLNDGVLALTVYNDELIAGGYFTTAGGDPANYIGRWNGTTWQPLGSGMAGTAHPHVNALTVYNGELIAGGEFTSAGGDPASYIARWNGATWQPLGTGMDDYVSALTVYPGAPGQAGELIAGGDFWTAGGQVSAYWARWNCPYRHGDLNCDGTVDFGDINPFVLALTNPTQYDVDYPDCDFLLGDMNCDGTAWFEDINPFVALLSGSG